MSLYNAVQRVRKLLGLRHDHIDRRSGGSGSVTVISGACNESRGTVSLSDVNKHDRFSKYDPVPFKASDVPVTGYVTAELNRLCSQIGLQQWVGMDPTDWKTKYEFKNVGKMLIRIRWQEEKQNHEILLEPGESTTLKVGGSLSTYQTYPEIKAFRYGEDE